jgi:hypothetical protein
LESEPTLLRMSEVRRAFRVQLLLVHPDVGGSTHSAAERIKELDSARRILMTSVQENVGPSSAGNGTEN